MRRSCEHKLTGAPCGLRHASCATSCAACVAGAPASSLHAPMPVRILLLRTSNKRQGDHITRIRQETRDNEALYTMTYLFRRLGIPKPMTRCTEISSFCAQKILTTCRRTNGLDCHFAAGTPRLEHDLRHTLELYLPEFKMVFDA